MRTDNGIQSEMFGARNPSRRSRRWPGMTGSSLVSARTDSRLRSEGSATSSGFYGGRWQMQTTAAWMI